MRRFVESISYNTIELTRNPKTMEKTEKLIALLNDGYEVLTSDITWVKHSDADGEQEVTPILSTVLVKYGECETTKRR